jgi:hypothetical protein
MFVPYDQLLAAWWTPSEYLALSEAGWVVVGNVNAGCSHQHHVLMGMFIQVVVSGRN